ncbi:hypothetical protein, partial [Salmonella enterica]
SILSNDKKVKDYKPHLQKLFFILKKASIYGIVLNDKHDEALLITEVLPNDSLIKIDKEINFNYSEIVTYTRPHKVANSIDKTK